MFCPKCGKEIPDNSQFCLNCDANVPLLETSYNVAHNAYPLKKQMRVLAFISLLPAVLWLLFAVQRIFYLVRSFLVAESGTLKEWNTLILITLTYICISALAIGVSTSMMKQNAKMTPQFKITKILLCFLIPICIAFFALLLIPSTQVVQYSSMDFNFTIVSNFLLTWMSTVIYISIAFTLVVYNPQNKTKNKWTAFILCFFFGGLGIHRFYVGKIGSGTFYLLTYGYLGIGTFIDLIMILVNNFKDNNRATLKA